MILILNFDKVIIKVLFEAWEWCGVCVPVLSLVLEGRGRKDCEFHAKFSYIVTSYPGREGGMEGGMLCRCKLYLMKIGWTAEKWIFRF